MMILYLFGRPSSSYFSLFFSIKKNENIFYLLIIIGENIITGKYIIKYIRVEEEEEGGSAPLPFVIYQYYGNNKTPLLRRLLC